MSRFQISDVRRYMAIVEETPGLGPDVAATILKDHGDGARDVNNLSPRRYDAVADALINKLNEFNRREELRRENPWRLSKKSHRRLVEATEALCAAWRHARELETPDKAHAYMRGCFNKYEDVGITGETRAELYGLLAEHFHAKR